MFGFFYHRIEPTPVAHITQCILRQSPTVQQKKEPGRERSKSIKIKLTKATTKLFHRKSVTKTDSESAIIANEYIADNETTRNVERNGRCSIIYYNYNLKHNTVCE